MEGTYMYNAFVGT